MSLNQAKNHKLHREKKPYHIKKLGKNLRFRGPTTEKHKQWNHEGNEFYSTNYDNFATLQQTMKNQVHIDMIQAKIS